jgi:hypothetical protein
MKILRLKVGKNLRSLFLLARQEGKDRGFLELCNYIIPSMTLLLIASQDYILIPYQKDGKWGFADTNGKIVIPPEYDAVGV